MELAAVTLLWCPKAIEFLPVASTMENPPIATAPFPSASARNPNAKDRSSLALAP